MTIPELVKGRSITRPHGGASSGRSSRCEGGDTAYRVWLAHTQCCSTCRAGIFCPAAVHLGRAWREARRG